MDSSRPIGAGAGPSPKPWSVDIFQQYRSHLTTFVDTKLVPLIRASECCRILVRAPVKSGKREIVEYAALRDISKDPKRVHAFISAWHRIADDEQRYELKQHNLHVFSIIDRKKADECITWISRQNALGRHVVVHLDECDHGSGTRQILGRVWRDIRENANVTTVLYSATPEEVLFSGEVEDVDFTDLIDEMINMGYCVRYTPPEGFCGPAAFLDADLVHEATPFFRKTGDGTFGLTPQGRAICADLMASIVRDPLRNILVLRLSYSALGKGRADRKENKAIYQFLRNIDQFPELADFAVLVDKDEFDIPSARVLKERIQWANSIYWRRTATGIPTLIVIDQTSSRSTEWACHNRVYATHDFRNILQFGTISQAQERVNHYIGKYGGFQPIKVYGSLKTFQFSAGRIDYETYLTNEWYSRKVDRRRAGEEDLYEVKKTETNELHPECAAGPVSRQDADRILQECASYADPSLSARVRGGVKNVPIVRTTWHPCNAETFPIVTMSPEFVEQAGGHRFQNPFLQAQMEGDRYRGVLRGHRRVLDYDTDVQPYREGFGVRIKHRLQICYRNGVLGVALRTVEGYETQNTLVAFRTMYRSH